MVARYGGDEFVILMPNTRIEGARRIAQALLGACAEPIALGPVQLTLKLSIGIASALTPVDAAILVRAADEAVYQAKAAGKATIVPRDLTAGQQVNQH